ncbi:hypothetical protein CUMW_040500 [Citrus unshiu]|nr:hypothetical protein CUMW_040500 [Citrus unshiu]
MYISKISRVGTIRIHPNSVSTPSRPTRIQNPFPVNILIVVLSPFQHPQNPLSFLFSSLASPLFNLSQNLSGSSLLSQPFEPQVPMTQSKQRRHAILPRRLRVRPTLLQHTHQNRNPIRIQNRRPPLVARRQVAQNQQHPTRRLARFHHR